MVTECIVVAATEILPNPNPFYGETFNLVVSSDGQQIQFRFTQITIKRGLSWCRPQALGGLHYAGSASCTAVHRLLDPKNTSVALGTLNRAARSLGCKVKIEFVPA